MGRRGDCTKANTVAPLSDIATTTALTTREASACPSLDRVIVRIAGKGRWRVPDVHSADLLREDLRLMRAFDDERETEYRHQLLSLCRYVRRRLEPGAQVADLSIPSPQMTLAKTVELLAERSGL